MKQSSNGIISANDPTGYPVSANLTIGDSVSRAGDLPSERYRMLIWDIATPDLYFIRHQPMDSFHGHPGEARTYNQFRPYTWYGVRIEPMAQLCSTNVLDLDYKAEIESSSSCYMLDKFDPAGILATCEDRSTNWFNNTARFRLVPRVNVDLDGVNSNGTEVADSLEMDPGVALVSGWTKLRIQTPWTNGLPGTNFGTYTLSWINPSNKWVKLNDLALPITIPCTSPDWPSHRGWPTNFTVTRSTNWVDWLDSVVVRLSHSISTEFDDVRLGQVAKVQLSEVKGLYTSSGTYQVGYTSADNAGRVYCNSTYDLANPASNVWNKNKQYVDFTVKVSPANATLPSGARIVWESEDPDDPSDSGMTTNAAVCIDPNGGAGNDNTGINDAGTVWEQIGSYTLSGASTNETAISNGFTRVRFNVTDDGGDNFIVKAKLKVDASTTPSDGDQTGVMTVWKKIDIESVTMSTADPLPVNDIPAQFTKAFVQFNIALSRSVSDGSVNNGIPPANQWVMGLVSSNAYLACANYCRAATGEFSKEGPGWFFVASAHEYIPLTSLASEVLYPQSGTAGNATVNGTTITLPTAIATGKVPDIVYVYNSSLTSNVLFSVKSGTLSPDRKTFEIERKDYHDVDSPYWSFLDADLTDYGFSAGSTVNVRVRSPGAYGVSGISPGLAGKTIVFTGWASASNSLGTLVHELTHAFGLAHLCGNWDHKTTAPSTSCTMNYSTWFILDDSTPRAPVPWTDKRMSPDLCAPHMKAIRESNLEDLSNLGW